MARILAIAHSYYMLLTVMQLRETVYKRDHMDLILTDVSQNAEGVFAALKKEKFFDTCYYLRRNRICADKKSIPVKLLRLLSSIVAPGRTVKKAQLGMKSFHYDIVLCYVADRYEEQSIFRMVRRANPRAKCQLYEEGYSSYFSIHGYFDTQSAFSTMKLLPRIMRCLGLKNRLISQNIDKVWYYRPALLQFDATGLNVESIPRFCTGNEEFVRHVNRVFGYDPSQREFDADYIYLEDCAYADGYPTDDFELIRFINDRIDQSDTFMVKMHPRSATDRFSEAGIRTNHTSIPLELIFLNGKNQGITFITISSGAPLTGLICFNSDNRVIMLYKCSKYSMKVTADARFNAYVESVRKIAGEKSLFIPETTEELDATIRSLGAERVRQA